MTVRWRFHRPEYNFITAKITTLTTHRKEIQLATDHAWGLAQRQHRIHPQSLSAARGPAFE